MHSRFDDITFTDETAKELTAIEKRFIATWRWPVSCLRLALCESCVCCVSLL